MRVVIGSLIAGFALLFGSAAHAGPFPDLPGMNTVSKATHARSSSTTTSRSAPADTTTNDAPDVSTAARSTVDNDQVAPILKLPGAKSIPLIGKKTAASERTALPDVLFVLAGIGTATALGMLWAVRRRFDRV